MSGKKIKFSLGFWLVAGLVGGSFAASLALKNFTGVEHSAVANTIESNAFSAAEEDPKYFYFNKGEAGPKISAKAYLAADLKTGEVILAHGAGERFPIASVTKLMTALVASEGDAERLTTVSRKAVSTYGGNGGLRAGEKIKVSDLLYPLLLESSNDAAEALAEADERNYFLEKMNERAARLGMDSTSFADPSGLSSGNVSTPFDLFRMVQYLFEEKSEILKITTERSFAAPRHGWSSNNQFLKDIGYFGGKSGYTDPAKQTVISLFHLPLSEAGNRPVAIVLLQSQDRYGDVQKIIRHLRKNIFYGTESGAELAWVKQKDGVPEPRDPDFITLSFLGDIMADRGVESSIKNNFSGDFTALFENLDILKKSDVVFANLEGPASDKGEDLRNLYSFRMDPGVIPALRGAGISVLSVANNHAGDFGAEAFTDTLSRLRENEILYTGGGLSREEAEAPAVIEKFGMKVGFLGFSDVGPEWLRVKANSPGILIAGGERYAEIIAEASKVVDFLVVSIHWGEEYQGVHNGRQEALAHEAIEVGAKIVIGHHPHVIQDTEVYKDGFIAYSLGNFIFDQAFSAETMEGMLLSAKLWRDGNLDITKNTVKLNRSFQPESILPGKLEKIKFDFTPVSP